jgi:DCN1-like protein 1/2
MWLKFLNEKWTNSVNKDMWNETYRFHLETMKDETLSFWDENSSWPTAIDEFVGWMKEKRAAGADKMETD